MRKTVGVFGSATTNESDPEYRAAVEAGRVIAENGYDLLCGGYGGMMEAVCRGCSDGGGRTEGIGLTHFTAQHNRFIDDFSVAASLGKRLDYFVGKSDRFLALPGGIGTVTEVLFVWDLAKTRQTDKTPVLLYGPMWESLISALKEDFIIPPKAFNYLLQISGPEELAEALDNKSKSQQTQ